MAGNIIIGMGTMSFCLFLEALLIVVAIRFYEKHHKTVMNPKFGSAIGVLCGVMIVLVLGNLVQIGIWGLLFVLLEEFERFTVAFYHSLVNFSTLGYGDMVMSEKYRLLGPLEALNGIVMVGVSTAILMTVFQDAFRKKSARS